MSEKATFTRIKCNFKIISHVKLVPCLQYMTRLQVAGGEDCFQILRLAVNILNDSQLGMVLQLGGWAGLTTPYREKPACYKILHRT
jgi:hypothetical protein